MYTPSVQRRSALGCAVWKVHWGLACCGQGPELKLGHKGLHPVPQELRLQQEQLGNISDGGSNGASDSAPSLPPALERALTDQMAETRTALALLQVSLLSHPCCIKWAMILK